MHSNGILPLPLTLDARCVYTLSSISRKLMSDYNKFYKGNKMKEVVARNVNFVLLVI